MQRLVDQYFISVVLAIIVASAVGVGLPMTGRGVLRGLILGTKGKGDGIELGK